LGKLKKTTAGISITEVADWIRGFEEDNDTSLLITLHREWGPKDTGLVIAMELWPVGAEDVEPVPSGSVRVRSSQLQLETLGALILRALYMLDFKLAIEAVAEDMKHKAKPPHN